MITISNEYLTATFQELGAELKSLRMEGKEYIWPGDPQIWKSSCPLLFPVCGGLKEDQYTYQGKEYHLPRHGFARTRTFRVESQRADQVVFLLESDQQTRAVYPFDFVLGVDLLKAPHHGNGITSNSEVFIQAVSPKIAVATGFEKIPSKIVKRYEATGAVLLGDRTYGYVHVSTDGTDNMTYETSRQAPLG